jgi:hypothetical protein
VVDIDLILKLDNHVINLGLQLLWISAGAKLHFANGGLEIILGHGNTREFIVRASRDGLTILSVVPYTC